MKRKITEVRFRLRRYGLYTLTLLLLLAGVVYGMAAGRTLVHTAIERVDGIEELSEFGQVNISYTLDTIREKSEGGFPSYAEEAYDQLSEACREADIIVLAEPTGKISFVSGTTETEVRIVKVLKGENEVEIGETYSTWFGSCITTDESGRNYYYDGYVNLMYPEYQYLIYAKASDFEMNGKKDLYLMGPLFSYMRVGDSPDTDVSLASLDLLSARKAEYMTIDPEVTIYLNGMKERIVDETLGMSLIELSE